jgi:hypothetical protein
LRKIRLFLKLPTRHKLWFIWCYFFSGIVRASILLLPFRWLSPHLGAYYQKHQFSTVVTDDQKLLAWRIGQMTQSACKYTPWESKCLVQAILARYLLDRYEIPCVLYLGLFKPKTGNDDLKAHAWLCTGPWVITGGSGHQPFKVVATYVSPPTLLD